MIEQTHPQDRRIVVGVDSSPGSKTALRWALNQARTSGAAVEAVTAWQDPTVYDGWVPTPVDGDAVAARIEQTLIDTVVEVRGHPDQAVDVRVMSPKDPPRRSCWQPPRAPSSWWSAAAAVAPSPAWCSGLSVSIACSTRRAPWRSSQKSTRRDETP